jgi:hypothetical protein
VEPAYAAKERFLLGHYCSMAGSLQSCAPAVASSLCIGLGCSQLCQLAQLAVACGLGTSICFDMCCVQASELDVVPVLLCSSSGSDLRLVHEASDSR